MMPNLPSQLSAPIRAVGKIPVEFRTAATRKPMTNHGKMRLSEKLFSYAPPAHLTRVVLQNASTSVIGIIISVRVSFTMVAKSPAASENA